MTSFQKTISVLLLVLSMPAVAQVFALNSFADGGWMGEKKQLLLPSELYGDDGNSIRSPSVGRVVCADKLFTNHRCL